MAKHTPGPWTVEETPREHSGPHINAGPFSLGPVANLRVFVAEVSRQGDQTDANARLIAAAPDLLATLKSVTVLLTGLDDFDGMGQFYSDRVREELEKATAAILNATGESAP